MMATGQVLLLIQNRRASPVMDGIDRIDRIDRIDKIDGADGAARVY